MANRVCRDCPAIIPTTSYKGRCPTCRAAHDHARGSRTARDYGPDHQAERQRTQHAIDAGQTITCWRCGKRLTGRKWALDHTADRTGYRGPACEQCNSHIAGRAAHGLPPEQFIIDPPAPPPHG